MKKFVSLFLVLLVCVCLVTAALQASGFAAEKDPDPELTATLVLPGNPDGTNTVPGSEDHTDNE